MRFQSSDAENSLDRSRAAILKVVKSPTFSDSVRSGSRCDESVLLVQTHHTTSEYLRHRLVAHLLDD